mmetsp:Transcript_1482/g.4420  ORF Transcript_1482/g.4420 Transcript_1482/m.4420 type:complete len:204 (+) Transcript_1482:280-891(+)
MATSIASGSTAGRSRGGSGNPAALSPVMVCTSCCNMACAPAIWGGWTRDSSETSFSAASARQMHPMAKVRGGLSVELEDPTTLIAMRHARKFSPKIHGRSLPSVTMSRRIMKICCQVATLGAESRYFRISCSCSATVLGSKPSWQHLSCPSDPTLLSPPSAAATFTNAIALYSTSCGWVINSPMKLWGRMSRTRAASNQSDIA